MSKMYIVPWKTELETGIEIVDSQHKEFMKQANKFVIKCLAGKVDEGIREEFDFLENYLQYHFQTEETFLFDSGYPDYEKHQAEHLQLKFKTKQVGSMLEGDDLEEVLNYFSEFVNEWIVGHIMGDDLDFSNYFREKQGK